jgi:hypothetical protein
MFPRTGPLWNQMPISIVLLSTSFGVPSKGALPPGLPHTVPKEGDAVSRALLHSSFKVPSKRALFQVPQPGPYGERCPFPEPSFTCPSGSPVKEHPPSRFPSQRERQRERESETSYSEFTITSREPEW